MALSSSRKSRIRRAARLIDTRRLGPPIVGGLLDITYEHTHGQPHR